MNLFIIQPPLKKIKLMPISPNWFTIIVNLNEYVRKFFPSTEVAAAILKKDALFYV
jgi:hypothetical protein